MSPRGQGEPVGETWLSTHLIVRHPPKLPQKSAKEGDYNGNDKGGKGKEGDGVQRTCQGKEKSVGLDA